ncbi:MAG: NAD/FAD-binding protein [Sedimenticola sp.]|nr:MAG: NAD/FAD-binding protein [Sedimenticola sp.]
MNIAVIGSGISGLGAAWLLDKKHDVTLYEAAGYLGGHSNTVDVQLEGITYPVDTGFLVHNELTYPNLIQLLEYLGVESHETEMSFSVNLPDSGTEWAGTDIFTVFAQTRNLLSLRFWRMLRDIQSFNNRAEAMLSWSENNGASLQALLDHHRYSNVFRDWYLLPMAAAIWSSAPSDILKFPATTFLRFCLNHHLLQIEGRPVWRSILGGARTYVEKMAKKLQVRMNHPVDQVMRNRGGVTVGSMGSVETYDAVVFATHAPDTLTMLGDPSEQEYKLLNAISYQPNRAVLHTDRRFLPNRELIWSAWNYLATGEQSRLVCVTYLLNKLQRLPFKSPVMVTLNPPENMEPEGIIREFDYAHPVFDQAAIEAQQQLTSIQGVNRTWFCGAWCGYGFHEDGLKSALRILPDFEVEAPWPVVL